MIFARYNIVPFSLESVATSLQKKKHKTGLKASQMGSVPPRNTFWMVGRLPDQIMSEPAEIARWHTSEPSGSRSQSKGCYFSAIKYITLNLVILIQLAVLVNLSPWETEDLRSFAHFSGSKFQNLVLISTEKNTD